MNKIVAVEYVDGVIKFLITKEDDETKLYTKEQLVAEILQKKREFVVVPVGSTTGTKVNVVQPKASLLSLVKTKVCYLRTDANHITTDELSDLPNITGRF